MSSLTGGGSSDYGSTDDDDFSFEDSILETYEGNLQLNIKIVRARELVDRGTMFDKQDPALSMTVGNQSKKTERQKDAGTEAAFSDKFQFTFTATEYRSGLKIHAEMWNESVMGAQTSLGACDKALKECISVLGKGRSVTLLLLPYGGYITFKAVLKNLGELPSTLTRQPSLKDAKLLSNIFQSFRAVDIESATTEDHEASTVADESGSQAAGASDNNVNDTAASSEKEPSSEDATNINTTDNTTSIATSNTKDDEHETAKVEPSAPPAASVSPIRVVGKPVLAKYDPTSTKKPVIRTVQVEHISTLRERNAKDIINEYEASVSKVEDQMKSKREWEQKSLQRKLHKKREHHIKDLEKGGMKREEAEKKVESVLRQEEDLLVSASNRSVKRHVRTLTRELSMKRDDDVNALRASELDADSQKKAVEQLNEIFQRNVNALESELKTAKEAQKKRLQDRLAEMKKSGVVEQEWGGDASSSDDDE